MNPVRARTGGGKTKSHNIKRRQSIINRLKIFRVSNGVKAGAGENKKVSLLGLLVVVVAAALLPAWAYADSQPYFCSSSYAGTSCANGGVSPIPGAIVTGGEFNRSASTNCSTTDTATANYPGYQAPVYSNLSGTQNIGGILANGSGINGSHTDVMALSLGNIGTDPGPSPTGVKNFSTGLPGNPNSPYSLSFANSPDAGYPVGYTGGLFSGNTTTPTAYCIPDYYDAFKPSSFSAIACNGYIFQTQAPPSPPSSVVYAFTEPNPASCAVNVATNGSGPSSLKIVNSGTTPQSMTVFLNGNLYIPKNIQVQYWGADNLNDPSTGTGTKLVFVVLGNIYIAPTVSRIDGWYIAQPNPLIPNSGNIYTCYDNTVTSKGVLVAPTGTPDDSWIYNNCSINKAGNSALTVNGALTAQNIVLNRITSNSGGLSGPTEFFNYTSGMNLGGPFFSVNTTTGVTIDSVVDLPPIY